MAWKFCFRTLRDKVPGREDMNFKDIVTYLVDVFETAAPDEPTGFRMQIESSESKRKSRKKTAAADDKRVRKDNKSEGSSTQKKRKTREVEQDESQGATASGDEALTPKRRKIRERMLKEGELQETNSQSGSASVDAREDAVKSLQSLKRSSTGRATTSRKSKRNKFLSEEKVVEDSSDVEGAIVNGFASQPVEDEMDADEAEPYTTNGGPEGDNGSDCEAANPRHEETESIDLDADRTMTTNGFHDNESVDLDTPVQDPRGSAFKRRFLPRFADYSDDETSDDNDMSDIEAQVRPRMESMEL